MAEIEESSERWPEELDEAVAAGSMMAKQEGLDVRAPGPDSALTCG
jgi:hypothetical protein